jgi:hypothetical protein
MEKLAAARTFFCRSLKTTALASKLSTQKKFASQHTDKQPTDASIAKLCYDT